MYERRDANVYLIKYNEILKIVRSGNKVNPNVKPKHKRKRKLCVIKKYISKYITKALELTNIYFFSIQKITLLIATYILRRARLQYSENNSTETHHSIYPRHTDLH